MKKEAAERYFAAMHAGRHTDGPWEWSDLEDKESFTLRGSGGEPIAVPFLHVVDACWLKEIMEAKKHAKLRVLVANPQDARLLAMAAEMYDALKAIDALEDEYESEPEMTAAGYLEKVLDLARRGLSHEKAIDVQEISRPEGLPVDVIRLPGEKS